MDQSEKISKELKDMEAALPAIEAERRKMMEDRELHHLMMMTIIAERFLDPGDSTTSRLQKELEKKKQAINGGTRVYKEKQKTLSKELTQLTRPVIQKIVKDLHERIASLKVERGILDKRYDGMNKRTILTISTNEGVVKRVREKISEEIGKIESMSLESIPTIKKEAAVFLEGLKIFDLEKMEKKEIDENDYFRGQPPQGYDPSYTGPRSGLPGLGG